MNSGMLGWPGHNRPRSPFLAPNLKDWRWVNQSSASAAGNGQGFTFWTGTGGGSESHRFLVKTLPPPPYDVVLGFINGIQNDAAQRIGLYLRESSSGKFVTFYVSYQQNLLSEKWTNPTTYAGSSYLNSTRYAQQGIIFLRFRDDGTNRIGYSSRDGMNFKTEHTIGRTDFITADEIGFGGDAYSATVSEYGSLFHVGPPLTRPYLTMPY